MELLPFFVVRLVGQIKLLIAILQSEFFTCLFLTSVSAPRGCLTLSVVTCCTMAADPSSLTVNVSSSPPAMASDLADKINRLTLARIKLEKELDINHECILEAIERKDRTVKIKKRLQS